MGLLATASTASPGHAIAVIARWGYAARGVVYLIVGGLALLAAIGSGGRTTDTKGALSEILGQPFGHILLALVAFGLMSYAIWRGVQAVWDSDRHGNDIKGLTIRAAFVVSSITHLGLAFSALSLVFGWGASGDDSKQHLGWLLTSTAGQVAVGVAGLVVIGVGIAHAYKGLVVDFEHRFDLERLTRRWLLPVCRFGLIARGAVFVIVGGFLTVAAWQAKAEHIKGLDGALNAVAEQPYGPVLLAVVALGLFAFGIYGVTEAWARRISNPLR